MTDREPTFEASGDAEQWPSQRHGYAQVLAVADGQGGAHTTTWFNPHEPAQQAEVSAHGVRSRNWHGEAASHD